MKYIHLVGWAAIMAALVSTGASAQTVQMGGLQLSCSGAGSKLVTETISTFVPRSKDSGPQTALSTRNTTQSIQGTVQFAQMVEGPQLRLFPDLMPALNMENAGKWRLIKDFVMSDTVIKGRVSAGLISNLEFEIDRRSGDIQIHGDNKHFSGSCTRGAAANGANKF